MSKMADRIQHWETALAENWGIAADLSQLDGEHDLNFLSKGRDGSGYVLKVTRAGCETGLVDMQVKAIEHMARATLGFQSFAFLRGGVTAWASLTAIALWHLRVACAPSAVTVPIS